jgi:hypothetical protein
MKGIRGRRKGRIKNNTVKKVSDFPVPSRDVTNRTIPRREYFNLYSRPGRVCLVTSLGTEKSLTFFYSVGTGRDDRGRVKKDGNEAAWKDGGGEKEVGGGWKERKGGRGGRCWKWGGGGGDGGLWKGGRGKRSTVWW